MSLATSDGDVVILKAGWIFRQKSFFRKWKKSWLVVCLGGAVRYYKNRKSAKPQKSFNLKLECMAIKTGRQCHYLLPPNNVDSACLIELIFTGDRTVRLCGQNQDAAKMWLNAFKRAQSDKELPTPRHERRNWNKEEIEDEEERSCWYCLCRKNKVEEIK